MSTSIYTAFENHPDTILLHSKYFKWYKSIINFAITSKRKREDSYYENHHILPKSMGGSNLKENLVLLTPKEHYVCHRLLCYLTTNRSNFLMKNALGWFISEKQGRQLTSNQYQKSRKIFSQSVTGENCPFYNKVTIVVGVKEDGTEIIDQIPMEEYRKNKKKYKQLSTGKVVVQTEDGVIHKVNREDLSELGSYRNFLRNKGEVTAIDLSTNEVRIVSKDEFDSSDKLKGHTYGKVTVYDIETGEHLRISTNEYHNNKEKYRSPHAGAVTVKNKITGETKKISMEEYDLNRDLYEGVSSGMIWIKNVENKKTKTIQKDDLEKYLTEGWVLGTNTGDRSKETVWMKNEMLKKNKRVNKGEVDYHLSEGWVLGRLSFKWRKNRGKKECQ